MGSATQLILSGDSWLPPLCVMEAAWEWEVQLSSPAFDIVLNSLNADAPQPSGNSISGPCMCP